MNATTLVGTVVGLADADDKLDDETKYLILAALEGEEALDDVVGGRGRPAATVASDVVEAEPVGAFLSQIAVSGFRGIGETATLTLQPGPGITVVSGRNGSGKSSFAEAFELAVTGDSYRWRNKAKLWTSSWRNIHHGDPCRIRVDFAVEGAPPATIGVDWAADAGLDDRTVWTQVAGEKRQPGLARLGWGAATELYRPILSYDELGGLFEEGPSKLYDALAKLLGLDEIHDAEKRIAQRAKSMGAARKAANDAVMTLKLRCAESDDERADVAAKLLRSRTPDLDAVERLATGTADGQGRIAQLRIVAGADHPGYRCGL